MVQTTAKSDYNRCFHMGQREGSLESARQIVPIVLHLIRPKEVVDVGCGLGIWLSVFAEGGITDYLGVDGSYVPVDMLLIPRDRFLAHDLTQPLQLPDRYLWLSTRRILTFAAQLVSVARKCMKKLGLRN